MDIKSQIEALLFISAKPMSVKSLAKTLGVKEKEIQDGCEELLTDYKQRDGGLSIIKKDSHYQMASSAKVSSAVRGFIKDETTGELSRPSLETLTVIAYRAPVSKTDLDRIRGVNCSLILRNLAVRGLVEAKEGDEETYYSPSFEFLRFLGVEKAEHLPDYERLSRDDSIDKMLQEKDN